jgi:hypothetical protein
MEIIIIINAVLGLFILVAFFGMSANIRKIKETLNPVLKRYEIEDSQARRLEYYVCKSLGDKPGQVKAVTKIIYNELLEPGIGDTEIIARYEKLKKKYAKIFDDCGYSFPPNLEVK